MVEAEYKINMHAHVAGLKRLSARANAGPIIAPRKVAFGFSAYGSNVIDHLKRCGVHVDKGLTEQEFERLEAMYQFNFPPDLKGVLAQGLPIGAGFPDWRSSGPLQLKMWINRPKSGILDEVEIGTLWLKCWGPRPIDVEEALRIARRRLQGAPVLVPIYGQCYVATSPVRAGNPVFFANGGDVFCCGLDVADFFQRESFLSSSRISGSSFIPEPIGGWSSTRVSRQHRLQDKVPEFLSFCEDEEEDTGKSKYSGNVESWSRSLDALAHQHYGVGGCERKSSDSARSVLSARTSSGSDCSSSSPEHHQQHQQQWHRRKESMVKFRMARRIYFWSELCEKGGSSVNNSDSSVPRSINTESSSSSSGSKLMEEAMADMANRLRRGGWKESEISEIVEASAGSASSSSYSSRYSDYDRQGLPDGLPDRQTLLEGLAFRLDCLSSSLRKAGWSAHDVTESMCLDYHSSKVSRGEQRRPGELRVSAEAAARLGMLASFVAQG